MFDFDQPTPRRSFLGRLAALTSPVASVPLLAASPSSAVPEPWQTPWLESLTGKHRTTFDVEAHKNGAALVQAANFLDTWRDEFDVPEREVNLVMGVRGTGMPIALRDEVWATLRLGEHYGILDPATGSPAVRNIFLARNLHPKAPVASGQTVEALQRRGVLFLLCRSTIRGAVRRLSAAGMGTTEEVHSSVMNGILPGVITVPGMVIAFTQMQERGVAYVYAG